MLPVHTLESLQKLPFWSLSRRLTSSRKPWVFRFSMKSSFKHSSFLSMPVSFSVFLPDLPLNKQEQVAHKIQGFLESWARHFSRLECTAVSMPHHRQKESIACDSNPSQANVHLISHQYSKHLQRSSLSDTAAAHIVECLPTSLLVTPLPDLLSSPKWTGSLGGLSSDPIQQSLIKEHLSFWFLQPQTSASFAHGFPLDSSSEQRAQHQRWAKAVIDTANMLSIPLKTVKGSGRGRLHQPPETLISNARGNKWMMLQSSGSKLYLENDSLRRSLTLALIGARLLQTRSDTEYFDGDKDISYSASHLKQQDQNSTTTVSSTLLLRGDTVVSQDGRRAVLLVGPGRSGKTTLALRSVSDSFECSKRCYLGGTDLVLVQRDTSSSRLSVCALPLLPQVPLGTLATVPQLEADAQCASVDNPLLCDVLAQCGLGKSKGILASPKSMTAAQLHQNTVRIPLPLPSTWFEPQKGSGLLKHVTESSKPDTTVPDRQGSSSSAHSADSHDCYYPKHPELIGVVLLSWQPPVNPHDPSSSSTMHRRLSFLPGQKQQLATLLPKLFSNTVGLYGPLLEPSCSETVGHIADCCQQFLQWLEQSSIQVHELGGKANYRAGSDFIRQLL